MIERFEKYIEKVKKMTCKRCMGQPRSKEDGYMMLRFYSTTIACCSGNSKHNSDLCKDPTCRVSRMLRCYFQTETLKRMGFNLVDTTRAITGIVVNITGEELNES
ncbi:hypothetical protein FEM48_Zijuj01G0245300 [Ziziphus jujuba var. spinosa]|uniref:Uncharacterized protein n=1 Tax=Ziziphus jujuba var. spinosa TaxID=714518 RepID=A0A978W4H2_ZIZJJ|nr:hypothetical protein FEM48_Zijuj01G0245300 [Ziziphus jujuba var. spinosa]